MTNGVYVTFYILIGFYIVACILLLKCRFPISSHAMISQYDIS